MKESEKFKTLLDKYRWGEVTEEERQYIEAELEKAESIQEYLFDSDELPPLTNQVSESEVNGTQTVRKIVQRKWLKHGFFTSVIILLILFGGWIFGRPLLNKLYFDPTIGRTEKTYSDFELYKKIDNSISITEDALSDLYVEQTGIGSYLLRYYYFDALKNETKAYTTVLKRGQLESQPDSGPIPTSPYLYRTYALGEQLGVKHDQELDELKEKVNQLPETAIMKVNLYFNSYYNQISLADVKSLVLKHKLEQLLTVGIASSQYDMTGMSTFGIRFNNSYGGFFDGRSAMNMGQIRELNEEYPHLIQNGSVTINSDPEKLEQYYLSMLDYLLDNKELGEEIERVFNPAVYDSQSSDSDEIPAEINPFGELKTYNQYLAEAKGYVKENGVLITHMTLLVSPKEFTALLEEEQISMVGVTGAEWMDSRIWQ